jgi:TPR repeat protein
MLILLISLLLLIASLLCSIEYDTLEALQIAAASGDAEAQYKLGEAYDMGWKGLEKDLSQAVELYLLAAEQGLAKAQLIVGRYYAWGEGLPQDYQKALHWLRLAAAQEDEIAPLCIFRIENYLTTKEKAEAGDGDAQYQLAVCYHKGRGTAQDLKQALHWYQQAILQGNFYAQEGKLELSREIKTFELLLDEANQGDSDSQYRMWEIYHYGKGTNPDHEVADNWLQVAATNGHAKAQYFLGNEYYDGHSIPQDYQKAVYWLSKAAEQGQKQAMHILGNCYRWGQGVPVDEAEANRWYGKAKE